MTTNDITTATPAWLGGAPACDFEWPRWPQFDHDEEGRLLQVLRSGKWWYGDEVRAFEEEFAAFQGAPFAVSCTNGTTALEMALRAIGVVEGDEVIVPPYTFIATASAVINVGAIPIFADIDPETLCLDPQQVARHVTARTRALVPVHVAGRMADMDALNDLAQQHNLEIIEDAAHAWGSQRDGRGAGCWSRAGTFSFQETKNITAGEGGILVTEDESLADLCRSFTHCGRAKGSAWYDHDMLGSNLRMTEFQAAILRAQTARLPAQVARREQNAAHIRDGLSSIAGLQFQANDDRMDRRSFHMQMLRVDAENFGMPRDRLLAALNREGVPVSAGWYRPLYQNPLFLNAHVGPVHGITAPLAGKDVCYTDVSCPVCEAVCADALWIPQYVLLADTSRIEQLVAAFRRVARHAPAIASHETP